MPMESEQGPAPRTRRQPQPNPILKLRERPTPLRAIRAMCAHCQGCTADSMEPGFRREIRNCAALDCPLYDYRPYQRDEAEADEGES